MDTLAYLSVLLVPLLLGLGILGFLIWQIVKERRQEEKSRRRVGPVIFTVLFWLAFAAFYIWRSLPE
jgi:hypothetical protein